MRRTIVLTAATIILGALATTPAEAALPVKGAKYSAQETFNDPFGAFQLGCRHAEGQGQQ